MNVCAGGCSFSKQVQRPKEGRGRPPGPGQYRMRGDLEPQALSTHPTSFRTSFPIAPKTQADKVHPYCNSSDLHSLAQTDPLGHLFEAPS